MASGSSAEGSREPSPSPGVADPASVRSLAIAKLKRAASLPRLKNGRRPGTPTQLSQQDQIDQQQQPQHQDGLPGQTALTDRRELTPLTAREPPTDWFEGGRNSIGPPPTFDDDVHEPTPAGHAPSSSYGGSGGEGQAEAEQAVFGPSSLARSASVSAQGSQQHQQQRFQLPSLQHIQSRHLLQRSNSAAARMMAMHKLTGEPITQTPAVPAPTRRPSQLAPPTINTLPPSPQKAIEDDGVNNDQADDSQLDVPASESRPRLRRSHTVGGGDGVERRSVVGRRMMMRLGNRVASPSPSQSPTSGGLSATPVVTAPTTSSPTAFPPSASAPHALGSALGTSRRIQSPTSELERTHHGAHATDERTRGQFADEDDGQDAAYETSYGSGSPGPVSANTFGHPRTPQPVQRSPMDGTDGSPADLPIPAEDVASFEDPVEDLLPPTAPAGHHAHFEPSDGGYRDSSASHPRLSSASTASTRSVPSSADHGLLGPGEHTDSFEFAAHLRRTNSGRTVRSVSPFPPGHPARSSTDDGRPVAPPLPSSPLLAVRGGEALAPHSNLSAFPPQQSSIYDESTGLDGDRSSSAYGTPPRQTAASLDSVTPSATPSAFSVASTASPGSIPILPPSDDGHGGRAYAPLSTAGDRGFSTASFPASVSGGELLSRSTGEWSQGSDAAGSSGNREEERTPLPSQGSFPPRVDVLPDPTTSTTAAESYRAQVQSTSSSDDRSQEMPPARAPSSQSGLLGLNVPSQDRSQSVMSWEEVGGADDREVPVDETRAKKSDSLAGKLAQLAKGTFRNRSDSASQSASPQSAGRASFSRTSPVQLTRELSAPGQSRSLSKTTSRSSASSGEHARRGSDANAGPSAYVETGQPSRHGRGSSQSSIAHIQTSPFAPSSPVTIHSGAVSPLPPVSPADPKYQDAKLMPFPGIARLEQERNRKQTHSLSASSSPNPDSEYSRQPPPTDSPASALGPMLSSSAFSSPAPGSELSPSGQQSYFDLPQRAPSPSSAGGTSGKKSWLSKKFSAGAGKGSSSDKMKRRPSLADVLSHKGSESSMETNQAFYTPLSPGAFPVAGSMATLESSFSSSSRSASVGDLARNSAATGLGGRLSSRPSESSLQTTASSSRDPSRSPVTPTRALPTSTSTDHVAPSPPSPNSGRFESARIPPRVSTVPELAEAEEPTPTRERLPSLVKSASSARGGADLVSHAAGPSVTSAGPEAGSVAEGQAEDGDDEPIRDDYASSVEEDLAPDSPPKSRDEPQLQQPPAGAQFPPKTSAVLQRLDGLLAGAGQPTRPSQLDHPPRKLLLYVPVLQVVNNNTVKDRFLFLFTDVLLIAKPILPEGHLPSLETKFIVKSVVELHKLKLSGLKDDDGSSDSSKRQHPVVAAFIEMFSQKTEEAMELLHDKSNLQGDNIASLLFKTPELDKARLGEFLSVTQNAGLLKGFVARFPFGGVRIDEALRIFLLSMRLPSETAASDVLLKAFANQWHASNQSVATFDRDLVLRLVMAIMQLNDYLNPASSGFGDFAFANTSLSADDFIQAFRERDQARHIDDNLLESIYLSIKNEQLSMALPAADAGLERDIYVLPTRIATRLTYKVQSEPMCITIPDPDRDFTIRMHGAGLKFDPPVLTFANSSQATFRVTGTSLGQKTILFSRIGPNASLYPGLPPSKIFFVERAFMRVGHTLQIAFIREPTPTKRKYLYSFEDAEARRQWGQTLQNQIHRCVASRASKPAPGPVSPQVLAAAEAVALQVLRDALVPPEEGNHASPALGVAMGAGAAAAAGGRRPHALEKRQASTNAVPLARSASSSVVYGMRAGRAEKELDSQLERERERRAAGGHHHHHGAVTPVAGGGAKGAAGGVGAGKKGAAGGLDPAKVLADQEAIAETPFLKAQTGREIAILCEQNSLIPLVLSFLQAGNAPPPTAPLMTPSSSPPTTGLGFRVPASAPPGRGFF